MTDNEQLFRPETVDEQIEQFASSEAHDQDELFDVQFVQTLQHIYHSEVSAQDRASIARARERIAHKKAALQHSSTSGETDISPFQSMRSAAMENNLSLSQKEPSSFRRAFSVLAAVLIIGLVVGSWIAVMHLAKQRDQALQSINTDDLNGTRQNIYLGRNHMVYKLDGQTGKVIWQHSLDPKAQELTGGMHVHVQDGVVYVIMSRDIYALDAGTGKERWHTHRTDGYSYSYDTVVDGRIYLYGFGANEPGTFSAASTRNGAQLWHNTTFHTGAGEWFYIVHGALYVLSDQEDLYAFDTATGVERWHFTGVHRPSVYYAPVVENGVVYFSMRSHFFALNEKTGQKLWDQQISAENAFYSSQVVNGIVYANSSQWIEQDEKQFEKSQKVYALDAKTGSIVWTSPPGYTMLDGMSITNGLLIAQGKQNGVFTLNAFRATDGKLIWQVNESCSSGPCWGDSVYVVHGTGYVLESEDTKTNLSVKIRSFDLQSGKLLALKPTVFGSTIIGMSNGIVYQQATMPDGNGKNPKMTDAVYAIRLSDGSVLWQYSAKNLNEGSSGESGVMAP